MGRVINALAILTGLALVAAVAWVVLETPDRDTGADAIARLEGVYNDVMTARAGKMSWQSGEAGAPLHLNDRVKTAASARAVVAYATGLSLNVDPDSLVVITAPRFDERGREVQEVVVEAGSVSGSVRGRAERQKIVAVLDAAGEVTARLQTAAYSDEPLQYRIRLNAAGNTELAVLRGAGRVEVAGKALEMVAGQSLDVTAAKDDGDPESQIVRLPPFPASTEPAIDARITPEAVPAVVTLAWAQVPQVPRYHVQVARTFAFEDIVVDAVTPDPDYAFEVPAAGTWYWRVASVDDTGLEGEFGFVRRFGVLSPEATAAADSAPAATQDPAAEEPDAGLDLLGDGPPPLVTEDTVELLARVIGNGLTRQSGGTGRFVAARGRIQLGARDVLESKRSSGLDLGRASRLSLEGGTRLQLEGAGTRAGDKVVSMQLQEGSVVAELGKNAEVGVLVQSGGTRLSVGGAEAGRARATRLDGKVRLVSERGVAEVWAGDRRLDLKAGFGLDVGDDGTSGDPVELPAAPGLLSPDDGAQFLTLDSPPQIAFTWRPERRASVYRVVISTDAAGDKPVFQTLSKGARLTYAALKPGTYHWTVRAIDADGFETLVGQSRSLKVVRDNTPPSVSLASPMDGSTVSEESIMVAGSTEADARVKINGKQVTLDAAGGFQTEIKLAPGLNQIVIEAVDRANNVTFENIKVRRE